MKLTLNTLSLLLLLNVAGCDKSDRLNFKCHEGTVIGKIRSWGGGIAISLNDQDLSSHVWHGHENVVEALNVPDSLWQEGKKVFMLARPATDEEKTFSISADGEESAKPIIYVINISTHKCPVNE